MVVDFFPVRIDANPSNGTKTVSRSLREVKCIQGNSKFWCWILKVASWATRNASSQCGGLAPIPLGRE